MNKINEYDRRQLELMKNCLSSFEKSQIELSSLIGSLEFLLNVMEFVDEEWENKFLNEITTLETVNGIELMSESEKEKMNFDKNMSIELVNKAILNLNTIIKNTLHD